jgi:hemerythrin-like metal-binding protein/PAS domain S-box-containing protein
MKIKLPVPRFSQISPSQKIYSCLAGIVFFLVFALAHLQLLDNMLRESVAKHDLAVKMIHHGQNLPFNAELVLREIPKAKDELERSINIYEKHFYTLKSGGMLYYESVANALAASSGDTRDIFQELETIWFDFKTNGEILINQETFVGGSEMATGIIDEFGNYIAQEVFKSVTPEVRVAIGYIESNSKHFIDSNLRVLHIHEKDVSSILSAKRLALYIHVAIILSFLVLLFFLFRTAFFSRVSAIRSYAYELASGNLDARAPELPKGELGSLASAVSIIVDTFKTAVSFIDRIARGDLEASYQPKSDDDDFGRALVSMKQAMVTAAEEEKLRKIDDNVRSWTTQGIAKFGEVLRQNTSDLEELSYIVISELIDYVGANQGGVFVLEEDYNGKYFNLTASYAYNRRKYLEKRIPWGDSLVGRCALERKTLYLREVPEDYLEITSGLGNYRPASLLICPLKYNDEIFGVMELASFSDIEEHQISFIEKISESIASTIAAVRINSRTSKLLEESKEQAERLSQQEEEMRQNMEEMQATQEEASIRTSQIEGIVNAIDNTLGTFEINNDGKYINANSLYIKSIGVDVDTLLTQYHKDVVAQFDDNLNGYEAMQEQLINGETIKRTFQYQLETGVVFMQESFTPVFDNYDNIEKIIVFASDITESKENEQFAQQSLQRVQEQELLLNENLEKLQDTQQILEEKDEKQRSEISQLVADNDAKLTMLKMREELNAAVLNASQDGIVVFNKRGDIVTTNNIMNTLTGGQTCPWKNISELIGGNTDSLEAATEAYKGLGKDIIVTQNNGEEKPYRFTVIASSTSGQKLYIGFARNLELMNKSQEQKDKMLGEALAKNLEYESEIERLKKIAAPSETYIHKSVPETDAATDNILFIEWLDTYSVGYEIIDKQHKKLVDIINELHLSFKEGKAFIMMQKIINKLIEYTSTHFKYEENLFDSFSYEHTNAHKIKHNELISTVLRFEDDFRSGNLSASKDLMDFLKEWLLKHILETDMEYRGKLGDGATGVWQKNDNKSIAPDNESIKLEIEPIEPIQYSEAMPTGIAGIDAAYEGFIAFINATLHKYMSGATGKELKSLLAEMAIMWKQVAEATESEAINANWQNSDKLAASNRNISSPIASLSIAIDAGKEVGNLLNGLCNEVRNNLTNLSSYSANKPEKTIITENSQDIKNETYNNYIEWNDSLATGIASLDDQHIILVDLLGQLHIAINESRSRKQIRNISKAVSDYAEYHFNTEEKILNQNGYGNIVSHTAEHKLLLGKLKSANSVLSGKDIDSVAAEDIFKLSTEIIAHIAGADAAYSAFLIQKGVS